MVICLVISGSFINIHIWYIAVRIKLSAFVVKYFALHAHFYSFWANIFIHTWIELLYFWRKYALAHTYQMFFFLHTELFFFTDIPFSLSRSQGSSWYPGGKISTHKSNWAAQNTSKWFQGHRNIDTEFRHYKNVFYVSYNKGFFCQAVMKHVSVPSLVWWWFHTCSCWLGEMMPTLHKHPIVPKIHFYMYMWCPGLLKQL